MTTQSRKPSQKIAHQIIQVLFIKSHVKTNQFYIGQLGKDLETRISQHKYSITIAQQNNGLFHHKPAFDHHMDWKGVKTIAKSNCLSERNVTESCMISGTFDHNVNMAFSHFECEKLLTEIIIKKYPPDNSVHIPCKGRKVRHVMLHQ